MDNFDINKVRVNRSREGTIFEIATLLILIIAWVAALLTVGVAWNHGSGVASIIVSVVSLVLLIVAYHPKYINSNTELKNIRQVELAVRMIRCIAVEMAIFVCFMLTVFSDERVPEFARAIPAVILVVTAILFTWLIRKAK